MQASGCDVVVAGAINTDLVAVVDRAPEVGETVTGHSFAVFGGGKAANQAVAARRSGARVALVGAVGDDGFGADRLRDLEAVGIDLGGVARVEGMVSGVALITVERGGENRIAYVPGPTATVTGEQIRDVLERVRPTVYLQPNEVPIDAGRVALGTAKALGAVTVLNAAPDPESVRGVLGEVDYLVVNTGEARALAGFGGTIQDAVAALARDSGVSVLLTAGGDGLYCHHDGGMTHVPAPRVDVVDTTGAGDAFCGALAARLAQGDALQDALRWAVYAASLSATKAGAQPSIPEAGEVDAFIAAEDQRG